MLTKVCTKCKEEKVLDKFYYSTWGKFGYTSACKLCEKERLYKWRKQRGKSNNGCNPSTN